MEPYRDLYQKMKRMRFATNIFFGLIMVGSVESMQAFVGSAPDDVVCNAFYAASIFAEVLKHICK